MSMSDNSQVGDSKPGAAFADSQISSFLDAGCRVTPRMARGERYLAMDAGEKTVQTMLNAGVARRQRLATRVPWILGVAVIVVSVVGVVLL